MRTGGSPSRYPAATPAKRVEATAPLKELFDYADKLRSLSQGRASSTLEPHSYAPAPDEVLRGILEGEVY